MLQLASDLMNSYVYIWHLSRVCMASACAILQMLLSFAMLTLNGGAFENRKQMGSKIISIPTYMGKLRNKLCTGMLEIVRKEKNIKMFHNWCFLIILVQQS